MDLDRGRSPRLGGQVSGGDRVGRGRVKGLLVLLGLVAGTLAALELGLRWVLGFGRPPLYVADGRTGYRLAPNQRLRRLGNAITVNEFSMRGGAIAADGSTLRLLLLGDSIANGGWWTDDGATIAARLTASLAQQVPPRVFAKLGLPDRGDRPVEVLNASANSWGPRNELGYLEQFGTFGAQVIVLLINTDDLFAVAPSSLPVGRDPNYPAVPPMLALQELYELVVPPSPDPELADRHREPGDRVGANLRAIAQIQAMATAGRAGLLVALTPLKREAVGSPKEYELKARMRLTDLLDSLGIPFIDFLDPFQQVPDPAVLYRDSIHLSPLGNDMVTAAIAERLTAILIDRQGSSN